MKLWMYRLDCHNTRMTGVNGIVGVVQAESYEGAERKVYKDGYPRHEYFRRILCELIGSWVENGEYPCDEKNLTSIVRDISYNNAVRYFGFDLEEK